MSAALKIPNVFNPAPGDWFVGLPNEAYHSGPGISKTKLDMFSRDPAALEWAKNCPVDAEKMTALNFGDAMHAICLEPDRLKSDFVVMPDFDGRTNAGKADKAAFMAANSGKAIMTHEEHKKLNLMFESVMAHPFARRLVEAEGHAEASYYWQDPETGVLCRCRPDKNITGTRYLVDIKTTDTLANFEKYSIEDYRYYVQDPFYCDGVNAAENDTEKDCFIFLVIQKTIELGRYPVRCVVLPEELVRYGRETYQRDLIDYKASLDAGVFTGIHTIKTPYNLRKQIEG